MGVYDQVDIGLQQYDASVALQSASEAAFRSASEAMRKAFGTLTDASSAQAKLAATARAHAQAPIATMPS